jgi:N-methylhydantoinase A
MAIDVAAARSAIEERIARPLGLDLMAAAEGILAIAETNMANAIRGKTVARGLDPREFTMLAYGGGGGMFACAVAEELEIPKIVIPAAPANFSAWGLLTSDYIEDQARTKVTPFDRAHIGDHLETLAQLEADARRAIESYGFAGGAIDILYRFDLRFRGQEYTITVTVDRPFADAAATVAGARERFVSAHRQRYGHGDPAADLEIVSLRCRAIGRVAPPQIRAIPEPPRGGTGTREIHFRSAGGFVCCPVVARSDVRPGQSVRGPAIIDEWTTTTVVHPGWQATADAHGNLVLIPSAAE